jgi:hypothetical protein
VLNSILHIIIQSHKVDHLYEDNCDGGSDGDDDNESNGVGDSLELIFLHSLSECSSLLNILLNC